MAFKARLSAPSTTDKYWIKTTYGGKNECILINSSTGSCLPNCVGYAWGRAYEIMGKRPKLSKGNAENWWGYNDGYSRGQTPKLGAIACWRKGKAGDSSDGAGHVAVVEKVNGKDFTSSNSGYGGTRFWTQSHKASNNYNIGSAYTFQGFIYLPGVVEESSDPEPIPANLKYKIGDKVYIEGDLFTSSNSNTPAGFTSKKLTNITRTNPGSKHPYNTTGDLGWMSESSITLYQEPAPAPKPEVKPDTTQKFNIGDDVIINGRLYGTSTGSKPGATVSNRKTKITRYAKGKPYPYNTTGDLGWMAESSITKIQSQPSSTRKYTVQRGDTVSKIAKQFYGRSTKAEWDRIKQANNLNSSYLIRTGQTLIIP